jgi:DNA-binding IclR family transcriptional regulator
MSDAETKSSHGVQSLEIGIEVLKVLVESGSAMMLKEIAAAADMPASKAHRYLVSLVRSGLVEQDAHNAKYDLGPLAIPLGLAAVDRLDRVKLGLDSISELRDLTNETTALSVWGEFGPVMVRWERPHRPITVNVVTGNTVSMLATSTGRLFAAWMPAEVVHPYLERELQQGRSQQFKSMEQVEIVLQDVREQGYSFVRDSDYSNRVLGLAAPVFNFKNRITMAVSIVGVEGISDLGPQSLALSELLRTTAALSKRLGSSR